MSNKRDSTRRSHTRTAKEKLTREAGAYTRCNLSST